MTIIRLRVPMAPPYLYSTARKGPIATNTTGAPDQDTRGDPTKPGLSFPRFIGDQISNKKPPNSTL
jgi:hypothetical protein